MLSWRQRAKCIGTNPEVFFADSQTVKRKAAAYCKGCKVIEQCLALAMASEEAVGATESPVTNLKRRYGVFGGMTPFQRWEQVYPDAAKRLRLAQAKKRRELRALGGL